MLIVNSIRITLHYVFYVLSVSCSLYNRSTVNHHCYYCSYFICFYCSYVQGLIIIVIIVHII